MAELDRIHVLKLFMVLFSLKALKKLILTVTIYLLQFIFLPAVEGLDFYSTEVDFILKEP